MKNTSNERVSDLLKSLVMTPGELAKLMGKESSTVYRILNGESTPTKTTLKAIADATGANLQWLLYGKGEMMDPNPKSPAPAQSVSIEGALSDLRKLFQQQLEKKDEQIDKLMNLLQKVNFLNPLQKTDSGQNLEFVRDAA